MISRIFIKLDCGGEKTGHGKGRKTPNVKKWKKEHILSGYVLFLWRSNGKILRNPVLHTSVHTHTHTHTFGSGILFNYLWHDVTFLDYKQLNLLLDKMQTPTLWEQKGIRELYFRLLTKTTATYHLKNIQLCRWSLAFGF